MKWGSIFSRGRNAKRNPRLVMQTELAECGLACICMILQCYGRKVSLESLRRRFSTSAQGMGMSRLMDIAVEMGMQTRALRAEVSYLRRVRSPCILHWNMNHFVVLKRAGRRDVEILDPARGSRVVTYQEVSRNFTGVLLEVVPGGGFERGGTSNQVALVDLIGSVVGVRLSLLQLILLSLAIEILSIVVPFQVQWIVDSSAGVADVSVVVAIGSIFAAIVIFDAFLSICRGWISSSLGASLTSQWTINLFSHLMRLPMEFFEKRHLGDIVSRFTSIKVIQNTVTGTFVDAVLSGLAGMLSMIVLLYYSVQLAGIVCAFLATYLLVRWSTYGRLWNANQDLMVCSARQQSELMESARGVQAIKLGKMQSVRISRFAQITQEVVERDMGVQKLNMIAGAINHGIFGLQRVFLLTLGAIVAVERSMSLGMLMAFLVYADQFLDRSTTLVDRLMSMRLLRLQLERVSDIALHSQEHRGEHRLWSADRPASLAFVDVSFRYSASDPWILRNVSFVVNEGESVALVGPSGCGKTTAVKILLGLLMPTSGKVQIGGVDIDRLGADTCRDLTSAVMQDDDLFAGSIAENICSFQSGDFSSRMKCAAKNAEIHDDIVAMPMGYETLVGDMGSSLSGGQKQRIMLARALFRETKILVMDEATSNLDVETERRVARNMERLACTRVFAAHRPDTISMCDRVIELAAALKNRNM